MRPSSGLTASLLLLVGLVACTDDRKPVDETRTVEPVGFGCLDDMGEVADDPLSPTPAPFCRIGVLGSLKLDGRPVPTVAVIDRGAECNRTPKGYAIDLAPGVAARFHAAFQVDPDFVPMDDSPACPARMSPGRSRRCRRRANAPGVHHRRHGAGAHRGGRHADPPAAVDARLVEAGSGRVLWRDSCRTDKAELMAAAGFPDWQPAPGALRRGLRVRRGFAATLGAPAPL